MSEQDCHHPMPPLFLTTNPFGVIGDSEDKRFTYVQLPGDIETIYELDWSLVPGPFDKDRWFDKGLTP